MSFFFFFFLYSHVCRADSMKTPSTYSTRSPHWGRSRVWVPSAVLDVMKPYALFMLQIWEQPHIKGPNPSALSPGNTLLGLYLTKELFEFRASSLPREWKAIYKSFICPQPHSRLLEKGWNQGDHTLVKVFRMTFLQRTRSSPKLFIS